MRFRAQVIVYVIVLMALGAMLKWHQRRIAVEALDGLLRGKRNLMISKIEIRDYQTGKPANIIFTNEADLDFLSKSFRHAEVNVSNSGQFFEGKTWLKDYGPIRTYFELPADLSYIIVFEPTFMDVADPAAFRVPLNNSIAPDLKARLGHLLRPPLQKSPSK
jgi:hypothetical protein